MPQSRRALHRFDALLLAFAVNLLASGPVPAREPPATAPRPAPLPPQQQPPAMVAPIIAPAMGADESANGARLRLTAAPELPLLAPQGARLLDRAMELARTKQWGESIRLLLQLAGEYPDQLVLDDDGTATSGRYLSAAFFVQMQLARMPEEAREIYRAAADARAERWYEEGASSRDPRPLRRILTEALASRWSTDAYLLLGELELERGRFAAARAAWQRLVAGLAAQGGETLRRASPDGETITVAELEARLVLVAILEGDRPRAARALAAFRARFAEARGRLGGREVVLAQYLAALYEESAQWPIIDMTVDWPTWAGNRNRNGHAAAVDALIVAWRLPLPRVDVERVAQHADPSHAAALPGGQSAPSPTAPASPPIFPAVADGIVYLPGPSEILAAQLSGGAPPWPGAAHTIFEGLRPRDMPRAADPDFAQPTFGRSAFTLSVDRGRLYARVGTSVTGVPVLAEKPAALGRLVALDLSAQGRLAWSAEPEEGWAFDGSPLADGDRVFVALRQSGLARTAAHVRCLDAATGRTVWTRFVCAADTPAPPLAVEASHNLLALAAENVFGDTIYFNTNLGVVAALRAADGAPRWMHTYTRAANGAWPAPADPGRRSPNPCLVAEGRVFVAPCDRPRILCFDADDGRLLWQTGEETGRVRDLLGTADQWLIAAGEDLDWIAIAGERAGRVVRRWPEGPPIPAAGRGLLSGTDVLFPARDRIYVVDARTAEPRTAIELRPLACAGGNLAASDGRLLIASDRELVCLAPAPYFRGMPPRAAAARPEGSKRGERTTPESNSTATPATAARVSNE